jgi:hypothetical protein
MKWSELDDQLFDMSFNASTNQTYHQRLEAWFRLGDRATKISIGVVAVASLVCSFLNETASVVVSVIALVFAIGLNISPNDAMERTHRDLFRRWTEVQRRIQQAQFQLRSVEPSDDKGLKRIASKVAEIAESVHLVEIDEPAPFKRLLQRCHEDQNERVWGVRSNDEVIAEKRRREKAASQKAEDSLLEEPH